MENIEETNEVSDFIEDIEHPFSSKLHKLHDFFLRN